MDFLDKYNESTNDKFPLDTSKKCKSRIESDALSDGDEFSIPSFTPDDIEDIIKFTTSSLSRTESPLKENFKCTKPMQKILTQSYNDNVFFNKITDKAHTFKSSVPATRSVVNSSESELDFLNRRIVTDKERLGESLLVTLVNEKQDLDISERHVYKIRDDATEVKDTLRRSEEFSRKISYNSMSLYSPEVEQDVNFNFDDKLDSVCSDRLKTKVENNVKDTGSPKSDSSSPIQETQRQLSKSWTKLIDKCTERNIEDKQHNERNYGKLNTSQSKSFENDREGRYISESYGDKYKTKYSGNSYYENERGIRYSNRYDDKSKRILEIDRENKHLNDMKSLDKEKQYSDKHNNKIGEGMEEKRNETFDNKDEKKLENIRSKDLEKDEESRHSFSKCEDNPRICLEKDNSSRHSFDKGNDKQINLKSKQGDKSKDCSRYSFENYSDKTMSSKSKDLNRERENRHSYSNYNDNPKNKALDRCRGNRYSDNRDNYSRRREKKQYSSHSLSSDKYLPRRRKRRTRSRSSSSSSSLSSTPSERRYRRRRRSKSKSRSPFRRLEKSGNWLQTVSSTNIEAISSQVPALNFATSLLNNENPEVDQLRILQSQRDKFIDEENELRRELVFLSEQRKQLLKANFTEDNPILVDNNKYQTDLENKVKFIHETVNLLERRISTISYLTSKICLLKQTTPNVSDTSPVFPATELNQPQPYGHEVPFSRNNDFSNNGLQHPDQFDSMPRYTFTQPPPTTQPLVPMHRTDQPQSLISEVAQHSLPLHSPHDQPDIIPVYGDHQTTKSCFLVPISTNQSQPSHVESVRVQPLESSQTDPTKVDKSTPLAEHRSQIEVPAVNVESKEIKSSKRKSEETLFDEIFDSWVDRSLKKTKVDDVVPEIIIDSESDSDSGQQSSSKTQTKAGAVGATEKWTLLEKRPPYLNKIKALQKESENLVHQRMLVDENLPPTDIFFKVNEQTQMRIQAKLEAIKTDYNNVVAMLEGKTENEKDAGMLPTLKIQSEVSVVPQVQSNLNDKNKIDTWSDENVLKPKGKNYSHCCQPKDQSSGTCDKLNVEENQSKELPQKEASSTKLTKSVCDEENVKTGSAECPVDNKKFNYVHYDPEMHWCRVCNVFPKTAKEYLNHLHSPEHKAFILEKRLIDLPWHENENCPENVQYVQDAPIKRVPIKGLQFFVSATAWYCKICSSWIGDLHCASVHLKSTFHIQKYAMFIEENPDWEMEWLIERTKAFEASTKAKYGLQEVEPNKGEVHKSNLLPRKLEEKESIMNEVSKTSNSITVSNEVVKGNKPSKIVPVAKEVKSNDPKVSADDLSNNLPIIEKTKMNKDLCKSMGSSESQSKEEVSQSEVSSDSSSGSDEDDDVMNLKILSALKEIKDIKSKMLSKPNEPFSPLKNEKLISFLKEIRETSAKKLIKSKECSSMSLNSDKIMSNVVKHPGTLPTHVKKEILSQHTKSFFDKDQQLIGKTSNKLEQSESSSKEIFDISFIDAKMKNLDYLQKKKELLKGIKGDYKSEKDVSSRCENVKKLHEYNKEKDIFEEQDKFSKNNEHENKYNAARSRRNNGRERPANDNRRYSGREKQFNSSYLNNNSNYRRENQRARIDKRYPVRFDDGNRRTSTRYCKRSPAHTSDTKGSGNEDDKVADDRTASGTNKVNSSNITFDSKNCKLKIEKVDENLEAGKNSNSKESDFDQEKLRDRKNAEVSVTEHSSSNKPTISLFVKQPIKFCFKSKPRNNLILTKSVLESTQSRPGADNDIDSNKSADV